MLTDAPRRPYTGQMPSERSSLGIKLAVLMAAVFLGVGAMQFSLLSVVAMSSFGKIEDRIAVDHAKRARMAVSAEKQSLLQLLGEDAEWDELYELVQSGSAKGLLDLLPLSWMDEKNLDLMQVRGSDGTPLWNGLRIERSASVSEVARGRMAWLEVPKAIPDDGVALLVNSDLGIFVVAAMMVRDTSGTKPGKGLLVFGRLLDRLPINRIGERIQVPVSIAPKGPGRGWRPLADADGDTLFVHDEGASRQILVPVSGLDEVPVTLELKYERSAGPAADRLVLEAGLSLLLTALIALAVLYLALKRMALDPVLTMAAHVGGISSGPRPEPLSLGSARGRRDEIGQLADRLDELIESEWKRGEELEALNRELERRASTDALTGLANRRFFGSRIEDEKRRLLRDHRDSGRPLLSFIMGDIDFFKKYNDHYGHQEGDSCLRAVAAVISSALRRPSDLAIRSGGEEFLVMLPSTDRDGAVFIAESIRERLLELAIPHEASTISPFVTMSFGVATMVVEEDFDSDVLYAKADAALYRAKAEGRDRVIVDGDSPPAES